MRQIKVTVFTPTYNRGNIIKNLYNSLLRQTNVNFEWLIVDDGSSDDTQNIIKSMIEKDCLFDIVYVKQKNQGKHVAINNGVEKARGKLFFIVDSDDMLSDDAIEKVINWEETLPTGKFAGIAGLVGSIKTGKAIGNTFKGKMKDLTSLERYKNNITGDKAEVIYTDVMKKYKFPVYNGEKFLTEAIVWNRIAADGYKIRWVNEIIYYCDYLEGGLTRSINDLISKNFRGYTQYIKELVSYKQASKIEKIRNIGMYAVRGRRNKKSFNKLSSNIGVKKYKLIACFILAKCMGK